MFEKLDPKCPKKISTQNVRKITKPKCSKNFRLEVFEKNSTHNLRKILDPTCSKKFRHRMFERFSTRILEKDSTQNVRKNLDPNCSTDFRPKMFEKNSTQNIRKVFGPKWSKKIPIGNVLRNFNSDWQHYLSYSVE